MMAEEFAAKLAEMAALHPAIDAAHERANREARLFHARLGHPVCESRDGKVVWISPAEVFAQYGLDQYGRPLPDERLEPEYYL
jgi:hypothetical protein